jgi:hypothetical protein
MTSINLHHLEDLDPQASICETTVKMRICEVWTNWHIDIHVGMLSTSQALNFVAQAQGEMMDILLFTGYNGLCFS